MTFVQRITPTVTDIIGVRAAQMLGFIPPCLPKRRVSDLAFLNREEASQLANSITIHVVDAAICVEDHVFSSRGNHTCPRCGTMSWMKLSDLRITPVNDVPLMDEENMLRALAVS